MVKIIKYNKITIYHNIHIKVSSDGPVYYLTVSTDNVINNNNNETASPEITRVFLEQFDMKLQEGYFLKYLNLRILQSNIGLSVDKNDPIMELLNECLPTINVRNVDTPFMKDSTHEKELITTLPLEGHALHKAEM